MIEKNAAGNWTCHEHPELDTADERQAVDHLHELHPEIVRLISRIEVTPLTSRQARRRAERASRKGFN